MTTLSSDSHLSNLGISLSLISESEQIKTNRNGQIEEDQKRWAELVKTQVSRDSSQTRGGGMAWLTSCPNLTPQQSKLAE